jgi:hypothetical protein
MNTMKTYFVKFVLLLFLTTPAVAAEADTEAAIRFLLDYVRQSDVVFIRNDNAHTPVEASAHMEKKYDYYKEKIQTPEDFIRYAATKSMISGKRYRVKTTTGEVVFTSEWLKRVLREYRLNPNTGGRRNE